MKPHQLRVIEEKDELDKKLAALNAFGQGPIFSTLDPAEQDRLVRQSKVMDQYSVILGQRIAAFESCP